MQQAIPYHVGECQVVVVEGGDRGKFPLQEEQMIKEGVLDRCFIQPGTIEVAGEYRYDIFRCIFISCSPGQLLVSAWY